MKKLGIIELKHKPLFDGYRKEYPAEVSEQTFTNLFIWRESRPVQFLEISNSLVIFEERGPAVVIIGPPIGPISLTQACSAAQEVTRKPVTSIRRLPERFEKSIMPSGWSIIEDRANFDYVYRRSDLAELAGRKYHKKRNLVHQCLTENDCSYEDIEDANLSEVRDMMDRWCEMRACGKNRGLCHEYLAINELFNNFIALGAQGSAIRVNGRIEAFTFGEALNTNTAVIHIEKAMGNIKGLYQLMNQWYCKISLSNFEFVNREQDLGIEGIRQAKKSYFPSHMVKKYKILTSAASEVEEKFVPTSRCAEAET